jgi:dienelactone hydrolase
MAVTARTVISTTREGVAFLRLLDQDVDTTSRGATPTVLTLVRSLDEAQDPYTQQAWRHLRALGWALVAVEMPMHGGLVAEDEPAELVGWAAAAAVGRDVVSESNERIAIVVRHLAVAGHARASSLFLSGTSRGGFLALHYASVDRDVAGVAAFAPVTDLAELTEFAEVGTLDLVRRRNLVTHYRPLVGRPAFVVIGDRDERVSTDCAIQMARQIQRANTHRGQRGDLALHVLPEPRGHTTPPGGALLAAAWMHAQVAQVAPMAALRLIPEV